MRPTPDCASPARALLIADHARLDLLAENLMAAARAGDSPAVCPLWNELEEGVLAHFNAEESDLFPLFWTAHRDEVAALRAEHDRIRRRLDRVGFSVELHEARLGTIEMLIRMLRKHAAREQSVFYRWTDTNLSPLIHEQLVARLARRSPQTAALSGTVISHVIA